MDNEKTLRRLKTIEGHLRGVIRMVDAALNKVSSQILENHLNSCVITAINGDDPKERAKVIKEITEVFEMSAKV